MQRSLNDCELMLRSVRGRLVECNSHIHEIERMDRDATKLGELSNLKSAKIQMEDQIRDMSRAIQRMKDSPDIVGDIVNENTRLWSGTISMTDF